MMRMGRPHWIKAIFIFVCLSAGVWAQAPVVEKVEPPNWWAGHTINPVRLLVRGSNLKGARLSSMTRALKIDNVRVNDRGDYLFCDVKIGNVAWFSGHNKTGSQEYSIT